MLGGNTLLFALAISVGVVFVAMAVGLGVRYLLSRRIYGRDAAAGEFSSIWRTAIVVLLAGAVAGGTVVAMFHFGLPKPAMDWILPAGFAVFIVGHLVTFLLRRKRMGPVRIELGREYRNWSQVVAGIVLALLGLRMAFFPGWEFTLERLALIDTILPLLALYMIFLGLQRNSLRAGGIVIGGMAFEWKHVRGARWAKDRPATLLIDVRRWPHGGYSLKAPPGKKKAVAALLQKSV